MFIYDENGKINEINPLCVLDFYVYEKCQRTGNGILLFNAMINNEKIEPRKLGYDRPSIKFINFLKKHFNLINYTEQNNNFIVFNDYFLIKIDKLNNNNNNEINRINILYDENKNISNNNYNLNINKNNLTPRKLGGIINNQLYNINKSINKNQNEIKKNSQISIIRRKLNLY